MSEKNADESIIDEADWERYPYDPELERSWWAFLKEHDRFTYPEEDLLLVQNKKGIKSVFIPKRKETLETGQRLRIIEHPDKSGLSISLIEIDPVTKSEDFKRQILVDRRPKEIRDRDNY